MSAQERTPDPAAPLSSQGQGGEPPGVLGDFRWQALFQRSSDPIFLLNRQRRLLFVNHAWEELTGIPLAEARGLACLRRKPVPEDPRDVVVRALCCPPKEVMEGGPGRTRRPLPPGIGSARWWDIDFLPFRSDIGLLFIIAKITPTAAASANKSAPLPEKLIALRENLARSYSLDQLAGEHPSSTRLREQVRLAGRSCVPVLLTGEAGTGKEWIARTIHYHSSLREGSFVSLDCARLPAKLLEASLLGPNSLGKMFNRTVYLREPASLSLDLQLRLSRLVEVSQDNSHQRFIAGMAPSANHDVTNGGISPDLLNALSILQIAIPPLRERKADIALLVERFLARFHGELEHVITGLTAPALEVLNEYAWPGNLRELRDVILAAAAATTTDQIDVGHLPEALRSSLRLERTAGPVHSTPLPLDKILEEVERRLITQALRKSKGNRSVAAEQLSIWRARLQRRIETLGIETK